MKIFGNSIAKNGEISHRRNNFDFIRLSAAWLVLFSHHHVLTGRHEPALAGIQSLGGLGVLIFFSISGYLVGHSWLADPSLKRFAIRRLLRIWPALVVLSLLTVFVVGPLATNLKIIDYFVHPGTWQYLKMLYLKIHFQLPGVFEGNPYARSVNGSLWTIPIEVKCYAVLALAGLIGMLRLRWLVPVLTVVLCAWFLGLKNPEYQVVRHASREFALFFMAGVSLACLRPRWSVRRGYVLLGAAVVAVFLWTLGYRYLGILVFLPTAAVILGESSTPWLRDAGRFGDLSYGVYLYAFPVQQLVIMWTWPRAGFEGTLWLSTILTLLIAYLSWHLIESKALRFKPVRGVVNCST